MKRSAALYFRRKSDGLLLCISRFTDLNDWGMPGGKMEPTDLSIAHACAREAFEEAGVVVDPANLFPIFTAPVFLDKLDGYHCTTFAPIDESEVHVPAELPTTREGTVRWLDPRAITLDTSTFHEHNRRLFTANGIWNTLDGGTA